MQPVGLRVCIGEFGVDLRFTKTLTCHLQVTYEVILLSGRIGKPNDLN